MGDDCDIICDDKEEQEKIAHEKYEQERLQELPQLQVVIA